MKAIFNNRHIDTTDFNVRIHDRSFRYGDGLFETIVLKDGKIQLLEYHYERVVLGMTALGILPAKELSLDFLSDSIQKLLEINDFGTNVRIKFQVWRAGEGLFTPETNESNYLLSGATFTKTSKVINAVGIAETVRLQHSIYSNFKTCNALPYIIAGQEKVEKKLDEVILLDYQGNISECSSSNLFWRIDKTLYTPDLQTGCVAGVMRRHIIKAARERGIKVREVKNSPDILQEADMIFSSNVTGITYFESYQGKRLKTDALGIELP